MNDITQFGKQKKYPFLSQYVFLSLADATSTKSFIFLTCQFSETVQINLAMNGPSQITQKLNQVPRGFTVTSFWHSL